ncbi:MAG TPA: arylesterase [Saprospiraceae bacterium]|nr:arylesterase [Saprospiraceae bacterium]
MHELDRYFKLYFLLLATMFGIHFLSGCKTNPSEPVETTAGETDGSEEIFFRRNESEEAVILFYGNSLTAGYGLEEDVAFPAIIQDSINARGLPYRVINAGLSGETTAGGRSRLSWVLQNRVDIFVLELGANDMLRGLDLNATRKNLESMIFEVRSSWPKAVIILCGMEAAPNMGAEYTKAFSSMYRELADTYSTGYIPFLLDGVAAVPHLNLPDLKHPNEEGHKLVAQNVWKVLKIYLNSES